MSYVLLKQVHVGFAVVSISGFVLRWLWVMAGSSLSAHRLTKSAPHVVDTLFLASGFLLAMTIDQYPWSDSWLTAKLCGLVAYILFGIAAMSVSSITVRVAAFISAILSYGWILSVARLKSPWGLLQLVF